MISHFLCHVLFITFSSDVSFNALLQSVALNAQIVLQNPEFQFKQQRNSNFCSFSLNIYIAY